MRLTNFIKAWYAERSARSLQRMVRRPLDETNPRHKSFLMCWPPSLREKIKLHYSEVSPGVYDSDAKPMANPLNVLMKLIPGNFARLSDFCERHGLPRGAKYFHNLFFHCRYSLWRVHDWCMRSSNEPSSVTRHTERNDCKPQ
jgi:hypothetical protein